MFVFSFKASSFKIIGIVCVCIIAAVAVISFLPEAGSALNVNKLDISKELSKIDVNNDSGRAEYLSTLGYGVEKKPVSETRETLPKVFDAVTERYNELQRAQGFDLTKYSGKNVTGYTYKVSSFPDGTKTGDDEYLATIIVYRNKVIAADLCCMENEKYYPLVQLA